MTLVVTIVIGMTVLGFVSELVATKVSGKSVKEFYGDTGI